MFREKYIRIDDVSVSGGKIVTRFSCSRRIRKYFASDCIFVQYDQPLDDVTKSLLVVPAFSALLLVAWATGSNIYVQELDDTYLKSIKEIKKVMEKWFPSFSFKTKVIVNKKVSNVFRNTENALLFSGGLDSLVSYIDNRDLTPHLIAVWGLDIQLKKEALWKKITNELNEFACKEEVPIHFIKSNIREFIYESLLSVDFGYSWWVRVSHGLTTISLCAPLAAKGIGTLLIASTRGPHQIGEERYPLGSSPLLDNKLSWADVNVIHDGYKFNRQQKIRYVLKKFIDSTNYIPQLRVCTCAVQELNCSKCNKCLETMAGLVLEGINPNECGFKFTDQTFEELKRQFLNQTYPLFEHEFVNSNFQWRTDEWKEIQNEIPLCFEHDLHNSNNFFEWLRDFDLTKYGLEMENKKKNSIILDSLKFRINGCLISLVELMPKQLRDLLRRLFNILLN